MCLISSRIVISNKRTVSNKKVKFNHQRSINRVLFCTERGIMTLGKISLCCMRKVYTNTDAKQQ